MLIPERLARIYWKVTPEGRPWGLLVTHSDADPGPEYVSHGACYTAWCEEVGMNALAVYAERCQEGFRLPGDHILAVEQFSLIDNADWARAILAQTLHLAEALNV